jgi:hypothetical protein
MKNVWLQMINMSFCNPLFLKGLIQLLGFNVGVKYGDSKSKGFASIFAGLPTYRPVKSALS